MLILFGLTIILAACSSSQEGAWLNAPGWRRAERLGLSSIPDPATIALDGEQNLYVFFAAPDGERSTLRVRRYNRDLTLLWESALSVTVDRPDQPRIVWDGAELRLFWLDGEKLYRATMERSGQVSEGPRRLAEDRAIASYDVGVSEDILSVWVGGDARRSGVYALADEGSPTLIDPSGQRPQVQFDAAGNLHAIWLRHPPGESQATVMYAHGAVDDVGNLKTAAATTFTVGLTSSLEGPTLGVDDDHAYVLWSILVRTGLDAGASETSLVSFPLGRVQEASGPQLLYVPDAYNLAYEPAPQNSTLEAGERVSLEATDGRATPLDLWPNERPVSELVIAARASVAYQLRKQASQSTLIFFDDGRPQQYQLLSFSRSNTVSPYVRSDGDSNLIATWLEPGPDGGFEIYLGATVPNLHGVLTSVTLADVLRMVTETIFGLLAGAALSPFAGIFWLIAPLFVLGLTSFLRHDDERTISPGTAISLFLALAAFWVVKSLTLPGLGDYVPFSSWIPIIPDWMALPLRWGVHLLIGVTALLTAWHFTFRRQAHSALNFMLIYAAVDSVLSMAVYGSIIYGFL